MLEIFAMDGGYHCLASNPRVPESGRETLQFDARLSLFGRQVAELLHVRAVEAVEGAPPPRAQRRHARVGAVPVSVGESMHV